MIWASFPDCSSMDRIHLLRGSCTKLMAGHFVSLMFSKRQRITAESRSKFRSVATKENVGLTNQILNFIRSVGWSPQAIGSSMLRRNWIGLRRTQISHLL